MKIAFSVTIVFLCGLLLGLAQYDQISSLILWLSEDINNNKESWLYAAACFGVAFACGLYFLADYRLRTERTKPIHLRSVRFVDYYCGDVSKTRI